MLEAETMKDASSQLAPDQPAQPKRKRNYTGKRWGSGKRPFAVKTLATLNKSTHAARYAFSLMARLLVDQGGIENASTAQRQLAQHAALLGLSIEDAACKIIEGEGAQVDMTSFMALINCQRRCLEALGLDRKQRDITPTIAQVIAEIEDKRVEKAQAIDAETEATA
jgi:hypothetical protein